MSGVFLRESRIYTGHLLPTGFCEFNVPTPSIIRKRCCDRSEDVLVRASKQASKQASGSSDWSYVQQLCLRLCLSRRGLRRLSHWPTVWPRRSQCGKYLTQISPWTRRHQASYLSVASFLLVDSRLEIVWLNSKKEFDRKMKLMSSRVMNFFGVQCQDFCATAGRLSAKLFFRSNLHFFEPEAQSSDYLARYISPRLPVSEEIEKIFSALSRWGKLRK